jgi:hypothetical protein
LLRCAEQRTLGERLRLYVEENFHNA